jgi:hypothetical protein
VESGVVKGRTGIGDFSDLVTVEGIPSDRLVRSLGVAWHTHHGFPAMESANSMMALAYGMLA